MRTNEELLDEYLSLKAKYEDIGLQMDLLKGEIKERMEHDKIERIGVANGEAKYITSERKNFIQGKAKEFLSEEQVVQCYRKSTSTYVTIMTTQAKATQKAAMEQNEADKKNEKESDWT